MRVAHGKVPGTCCPLALGLEVPALLPGREGKLVVNLTIFPFGCTYKVSIPSAAPISALGAVRLVVATLEGRVKDRVKGVLRSVFSGVVGAVVDIVATLRRIAGSCETRAQIENRSCGGLLDCW